MPELFPFQTATAESIFPSLRHMGLISGATVENLEKLPVRSSSQNVYSELNLRKVPANSGLLGLNPSLMRMNPSGIPYYC